MENKEKTYTVYVDDLSHSFDSDTRIKFGEYATYEEAVAVCKQMVDKFIKDYGSSPEELAIQRHTWGEDPWITPEPEGEHFSSSAYFAEAHARHFNGKARPDSLVYTKKIKDAIKFSIKTHEVYQKQKRKGKDIPYITHPLTAGLILARAGADEDTIVAGILHDTIEDSIAEKKVTAEMLTERFGQPVADLVMSVTEQNKQLSWEERKAAALDHIKHFSNNSVLVKSSDIISNSSELLADYESEGESVFERFGAPKGPILQNHLRVIAALLEKWPENPLAHDLRWIVEQLQNLEAGNIESEIASEPSIEKWRALAAILESECPLVSHTRSSRLFSTVRRMKAEKEMDIPISHRSAFAVSKKYGIPSNQMDGQKWEKFYEDLCAELKADYPDLHAKLFLPGEKYCEKCGRKAKDHYSEDWIN